MRSQRIDNKTRGRIVSGPKPAGDHALTSVGSPLLHGRQAFERRAWATAFAQLTAADRVDPLVPEDLERIATAAYLSGRDEDSEKLWTRAYQQLIACDQVERAVRCAFWLAIMLFDKGQAAPGSGWIARARRLLDDRQLDCVERGYLLMPNAIERVIAGDFQAASSIFEQAASIGDRFGDDDLKALARHGRGRALTRLGRIHEGASLFDEAMVAVMANEVSPIAAGVVYCGVIEGCYEIFDLKRAQEWTAALGRWCDAQPDLIPFRGACLVRRSEILQVRGVWADAFAEATKACERLLHGASRIGIALAFYQVGELHRLRGEFTKAEDAYLAARERGKNPEPGTSLLRLAEGQVDAAVAAIHRALEEARDRKARARVLIGAVDVFIAAGDVKAARDAAAELTAIALELDAPLIRAHARQAEGAVLLAESNPQAALDPLREAASMWRELDVPYETARVGVSIALACRALGNRDGAIFEFEAARRAFEQLGARPDVARVAALAGSSEQKSTSPLTPREVEVLGLLATGRTNRAIAQHLRISEKTVARHLSNIFNKLGVSTRSAATAYAYRNNQVLKVH
jgi:DNA-binding CsgD family transcriptional regulator